MDAVLQVHGGVHIAHKRRCAGAWSCPYRLWMSLAGPRWRPWRSLGATARWSTASLSLMNAFRQWPSGVPGAQGEQGVLVGAEPQLPASVSDLAGSAGILPALGTRSVPSVPWGRRAGETPLPSPASGARIQPSAGREAGHETLVASRRKKVGPGLPAAGPLYAFTSRQRMRPPLGVAVCHKRGE